MQNEKLLEKIKIPLAAVLQLDDVGWDDGRDLRLRGLASSSGLPRHHALEDYELLERLGGEMNSKITVALCLGDWDKDNILRGVVGATHNPKGWDRASEIDIKKFEKYRDVLDNSPNIEFTVHGLLHGNYDENGKRINESECFKITTDENGRVKNKSLISDEYFLEHIDLFFKIYESWGFKKKINIYIAPCGMGGISYEEMERVCELLYSKGIRYWTNSGFPFDGPVKIIRGVACLKQNGIVTSKFKAPWDAYDVDPDTFPDFLQEDMALNSTNLGLHWTNILRYNPKSNFEQIEPWANYFKRQDEIFGFMTASDFRESVSQSIYYQFAKISTDEDKYVIDLSRALSLNFEELKREFFVSFRKDVVPTSCDGGVISLYRERGEFNIYKIVYDTSRLTISVK